MVPRLGGYHEREFAYLGIVKSLFFVIPAKAGIQSFQALLDSRLRGSDDLEDFLRMHQF